MAQLIQTAQALQAVVRKIRTSFAGDDPVLCFDFETTGLDTFGCGIVGISLSWSDKPEDCVYIPTGHLEPKVTEQPRYREVVDSTPLEDYDVRELKRTSKDVAAQIEAIEADMTLHAQFGYSELTNEWKVIVGGVTYQAYVTAESVDGGVNHKFTWHRLDVRQVLDATPAAVAIWNRPDLGEWQRISWQLQWPFVAEQLQPLFNVDGVTYVAHNLSFDWSVAVAHGLDIQMRYLPSGMPNLQDTMILASVIYPGWQHGLKNLCEHILGYTYVADYDELTVYRGQRNSKHQRSFSQVPMDRALQYASDDTHQLYRLYRHMQKRIQDFPEKVTIYESVEAPLLYASILMKYYGVALDIEYLTNFRSALEAGMRDAQARVAEAGVRVGVGDLSISRPSLASLFDAHDLTRWGSQRSAKTGKWGVGNGILEAMTDDEKLDPTYREIAGQALRYFQYEKMLSPTLTGFFDSFNRKTQRVHATFDQRGTISGRYSSYGPNMQNIPGHSIEGFHPRQAIVAPAGHKLVAIDYSQIELRVLAHMAADTAMIEAFKSGVDIHAATAASIYHKPVSEVTKAERGIGKVCNFAAVYGGGPGTIVHSAGCTFKEAEQHLAAFFNAYKGVHRFQDRIRQSAGKIGYVETILGRRRSVETDGSGWAQNYAINAPVQGSAADIIKLAMVQIHKLLQGTPVQLVMQVHDELVFYVPDYMVDSYIPNIVRIMETAHSLYVPLWVDVEVGNNWHEMTSMEIEHVGSYEEMGDLI